MLTQYAGPHGGPWGADGGGGGWWWIAWPIGWLVFLAVVGLVVWAVVRASQRNQPAATGYTQGVGYVPSATEGARRILAERFARGEIDEEEYRNRLNELS
ncbi:MAG: SHOCT domain-containing protein [Streptosporangiales bacterium]|nr:SHOCT domain-containing protein [Streptosporangiales bacterium]